MALLLALAASAAIASAQESPGAKAEEKRYAPLVVALWPGVSYPGDGVDSHVALSMIGLDVGDIDGFSLAGAFASAIKVHGLEASGLWSESLALDGFQGATIFNKSEGARGMQLAGIFNLSGDLSGTQLAAIFNRAGKVEGFQAAGALNIANDLRGTQVGLVNIANEVKGLQLGMVNISRNGIAEASFCYDPLRNYAHAYWASGMPRLFSTIGIGAPLSASMGNDAVASIGIGLAI
jgi:hypothetical protein